MFKCYEGHLFDEPKIIKEPHGELLAHCPVCGDSFEEAERCEICGEWCRPDEMYDDACDDCINDYRYDWQTCWKFAHDDKAKTEIEVNSVLATLFSAAEIEDVMFEYLLKITKPHSGTSTEKEIIRSQTDCIDFINDDRYWFAEMILAERKNANV